MEYINTEGSLWIDRVGVPYTDLQRARLGGVALARNALYPGHTVSWKFTTPANDQSAAILVPDATPTGFKVIAFNLETFPVRATITGWNVEPGTWEISQGTDTNNDDVSDQSPATRSIGFERSRALEFTFPPRATTVLTFKLKTPGTPYEQRPDLAIDREDVQVRGREVRVRVHSLGSVSSPAAQLAFCDRTGRIATTSVIPPMSAPTDLMPKTTEVILRLPAGINPVGGRVEIDPDHKLEEITAQNNSIHL